VGWATRAIESLRRGEAVTIRPRGRSMSGRVEDGDLVTLSPCDPASLSVGDVVLVRVRGNDLLHLVKAIDGNRILIGNNRGGTNGWVGRGSVHGRAVRIEPGS